MINRQLRLMAMARDLLDRKAPPSGWEKSWGFTTVYVARKAAAQATRRAKGQINLM